MGGQVIFKKNFLSHNFASSVLNESTYLWAFPPQFGSPCFGASFEIQGLQIHFYRLFYQYFGRKFIFFMVGIDNFSKIAYNISVTKQLLFLWKPAYGNSTLLSYLIVVKGEYYSFFHFFLILFDIKNDSYRNTIVLLFCVFLINVH